jgi:hypothetical protein
MAAAPAAAAAAASASAAERQRRQLKLPGCERKPNGEVQARPVTSEFVRRFMRRSHGIHKQARDELPANVANVLHIWDTQLTQPPHLGLTEEQHKNLDSAYNYRSDVARCGVYIWVHKQFAEKVYVGMYCGASSSLTARSAVHIRAANSPSKLRAARSSQWGAPKDDTSFQLYAHMLSLEKTGDNPFDFCTLDVRIISKCTANEKMECFTVLFDKGRQECFARLPIVQYTHVSSMMSESCGHNIIISQLHRFKELIMSEANYVLEAAKLVRRLQMRGYAVPRLMRRLERHLFLYPDTGGEEMDGI